MRRVAAIGRGAQRGDGGTLSTGQVGPATTLPAIPEAPVAPLAPPHAPMPTITQRRVDARRTDTA
jgi:hypothetical protein